MLLYSEALMEPLPNKLGQVACGCIPLPGCCQGLFVELHDLGHLIVQAVVQEAAPGGEGLTQQGKMGQCAL